MLSKLRKNTAHHLLDNARINWAESLLSTCESWMSCGRGGEKMWEGYRVLLTMQAIEARGNGLVGRLTSRAELQKAKAYATEHLSDHYFTSEFLRELLIVAMGMSDIGYLYTRSEIGLIYARERRGLYQFKRINTGQHFFNQYGEIEYVKIAPEKREGLGKQTNAQRLTPGGPRKDEKYFFAKTDYIKLEKET